MASAWVWSWLRMVVLAAAVGGVAGCQQGPLTLAWSVRQGLAGQWAVHGGQVFVVGRYLSVYETATGRLLRSAPLERDFADGRGLGPEVAVSQTCVAFGWYGYDEKRGTVFCHDPQTLGPRWRRDMAWVWHGDSTMTFSVMTEGEFVYAQALGKPGENLFKLRAADGAVIWSTSVGHHVQSGPILQQAGRLLIRSRAGAFSDHGFLQGVDAESGKLLWKIRIEGATGARQEGFTAIAGGRAYASSETLAPGKWNLYVVEVSTGTVIAHRVVDKLNDVFAVHDNALYFGWKRPGVVDLPSLKLRWQTPLGKEEDEVGPNVVAQGALDPLAQEIYLGDYERDVWVLSATDGRLKGKVNVSNYWRWELAPVKAFFGAYGVERLASAQGLLFVGTVDKSLFVFRSQAAR